MVTLVLYLFQISCQRLYFDPSSVTKIRVKILEHLLLIFAVMLYMIIAQNKPDNTRKYKQLEIIQSRHLMRRFSNTHYKVNTLPEKS